MLYLMYLILFLYSLPLILIGSAAFESNFFAKESSLVYAASTISVTFVKQLWETFGALAVPMITVFAIPTRDATQTVPRATLVLVSVLAAGFLLSVAMWGVVSTFQDRLQNFGKDVSGPFTDMTSSYMKGFLTYIGLTVGISIKKS